MILNDLFRKASAAAANGLGSPVMFVVNLLLILLWLVCGPIFHYSDTWQLVINTSTTVITYMAVFLIQNTQNRDAKAVHLKLDELIRSIEGARNRLIDLQDLTDEELEQLQRQFQQLKLRADQGKLGTRLSANDLPEVGLNGERSTARPTPVS
jgi:low affinity Fe/Cu permease